MANYPPYQQPLVDRATGLVSTPWQLFFLHLAGADGSNLAPGSITLAQLAPLTGSPRLLGRGSSGAGPVEELFIGTGLTLTGLTLSATGAGIATLGYWTPITNGDPLTPEILFDSAGDCIVGFVPTA